jgi:FlaA1/EpsC-like NDP-sugar epimerase
MNRDNLSDRLRRLLARRLLGLRNRHFMAMDALFFAITPTIALLFRLEGRESLGPYVQALIQYTAFAVVIRVFCFYIFGIYSFYWRSATARELGQLVLATAVSVILIAPAYLLPASEEEKGFFLPRSTLLIDGMLAFLAASMTRYSVRVLGEAPLEHPGAESKRVLIVGAGVIGQMIVREMRARPHLGMVPVGFVDDDPAKQHLILMNLPVYGGCDRLPYLVDRHDIDEVVIAITQAPGKRIREIVHLCDSAGVRAKTIPSMTEIIDGRVSISKLRTVQIEDLLRREPIATDLSEVGSMIRGRRVMVTGGGGSIGRELCRQVLQCAPGDLIILGHGENSVFEARNELNNYLQRHPEIPTRLHAVIADIRFEQRIRSVVSSMKPDIIFHAAAHKHVPLMEENPVEAVTNNILGTRNMLRAAIAADVGRFVLISTDKAVKPTSVMGASKRAAELLVIQAARQSGKPYVAVRFGNVLGSRGSVVPVFKKQIEMGGPVTVSHPDMTRYFMTIPEAVQLVLQAAVLGKGGSVLMLDMGEPVKIQQLAEDLIRLSGLEVGRDIDIVYTGTRPGEKLFEELLIPGEVYEKTDHQSILVVRSASDSVPQNLDALIRQLEKCSETGEREEIIGAITRLVPEFQPDEARQMAVSPPPQKESLPASAREKHRTEQRQPASVPSLET